MYFIFYLYIHVYNFFFFGGGVSCKLFRNVSDLGHFSQPMCMCNYKTLYYNVVFLAC